jgi:hypothetical protein
MSHYWALRLYQNDVAPSHYERTNFIGLAAAHSSLSQREGRPLPTQSQGEGTRGHGQEGHLLLH